MQPPHQTCAIESDLARRRDALTSFARALRPAMQATRFAADRPRSFRTFSSCASWPSLALPAADDGP
jgi:hypothetical protein